MILDGAVHVRAFLFVFLFVSFFLACFGVGWLVDWRVACFAGLLGCFVACSLLGWLFSSPQGSVGAGQFT